METAEALQRAVDDAWARGQNSGHRYHLGASIIGRSCAREVWFKFWWWHSVRHTGRMLRLFDRGHREEAHAVGNLRKIGAVVEDVDAQGRQTRFSTLWGLFGGERDAKVSNLDEYGLPGEGLLEVKTHNDKSFKHLNNKGLLSAKPEHFVQMQLYMSWMEVSWGLYYAVNKNDDSVYFAVVPARPDVAAQYTDRAKRIIESPLPPQRISEDPSWYVCRFCDFKRHCHGTVESVDGETTLRTAEPDKNCRTCENIQLRCDDENESHWWFCRRWEAEVPKTFLPQGCDAWKPREID